MSSPVSPVPFGKAAHLKRHVIHVGEIFASRRPAVVETLLGSCVSACLIDRGAKVGGMNHIRLPGSADLARFDDTARYGVNAMELLINRLNRLGIDRKRLEAKIFGGANILDTIDENFNPGMQNASFVREFLKLEGIPVVGEDLGGNNARRVFLRTDTGEVLLKTIPRLRAAGIAEEEKIYRRKVQREIARPARVSLFKT